MTARDDDRRLDRLGGQREFADALWAALEKVADREAEQTAVMERNVREPGL